MLKKILLFAFIASSYFHVQAQIVFESNDYATAGDIFVHNSKYYLPADTLTLAHFDQNWDFTLYAADSVDSLAYVLPVETDYADSFPGANLSIMDKDGALLFLNKTDQVVEIIGVVAQAEQMGFPFVYSHDEGFLLAQFPMNYQNQFENQTSFSIAETPDNLGLDLDSLNLPIEPDSIRLNVSITDQSQIDAFGSVVIADGSYECLRENRYEIFSIGIEMQVFSIWIPVPEFTYGDTTHLYRWWAKDYGHPIAEVYAGPLGNVLSLNFLKTIPQNVINTKKQEINIYPNPCTESINIIDYLTDSVTEIEVYDVNGRLVLHSDVSKNNGNINVLNLKSGLYFYSLTDKTHTIFHRGKFLKAKN